MATSTSTQVTGAPAGLKPGETFQPANASVQNSATITAATTASVYAEAVLRTGTMPASLNGAPNLDQHQTTSKAVVQEWIDTIRVVIYQSNADLGAYAVKFQNLYNVLYGLAGNLTPKQSEVHTRPHSSADPAQS